ncbi:MAG: SPOR domain-containing protein [Comamonadaceae bacterium]|nr:MAG: SPOR domain-containing protein [Comamonadaceae bacterium]
MLRLAVLVLILANAGYYAWYEGWLRGVGLAPTEQTEPQRLQQQINPEQLRVVRTQPNGQPLADAGNGNGSASAPASSAPAAASSAGNTGTAVASAPTPSPAPTPEPTVCLQAGVFDQKQADALRPAVAAALPSGSWSLEGTSIAGRWMVYMGRFADDEALEKKRAELRGRKVPYDRPGAALEPGLSLGRFSTEEAAERALAALGTQGVRTARVVQERSDATGYQLRVPEATADLRAKLEALRAELGGKPVRTCS